MYIKQIDSQDEKDELDQLLWDVLWRPLGFPRDVRDQFNLDSPMIELAALDEEVMVGGLVAYFLSDTEVELHCLAVSADAQGKDIGTELVKRLISLASDKSMDRIDVYSRDTSEGFYTKLGFTPDGDRIEHPLFIKHGIFIQRMLLYLRSFIS